MMCKVGRESMNICLIHPYGIVYFVLINCFVQFPYNPNNTSQNTM